MKKLIVLGFILLSISGCSSNQETETPLNELNEPTQIEGISMTIKDGTLARDGATLIIEDTNGSGTYVYGGSFRIDKSENESLQDLSIFQYSDIAITLDNTSTVYDITNENTIKELYIDNISISTGSDKGNQYVMYKNPLDFAKYKEIKKSDSDKIEYNIVNTNEQNNSTDYSTPTFYADCSNPISLEYMNQNIITNYAASSDSNTISFNGKVLQEAGIDLNDINYTLNFTINIVNNLNEKFICPVRLKVDLSGDDGGIYKGYKYENTSGSGYEYNFIKIVK